MTSKPQTPNSIVITGVLFGLSACVTAWAFAALRQGADMEVAATAAGVTAFLGVLLAGLVKRARWAWWIAVVLFGAATSVGLGTAALLAFSLVTDSSWRDCHSGPAIVGGYVLVAIGALFGGMSGLAFWGVIADRPQFFGRRDPR